MSKPSQQQRKPQQQLQRKPQPDMIIAFNDTDWGLVVRSIEEGYKGMLEGGKNKYDDREKVAGWDSKIAKVEWDSKSAEEKLSYVKKWDYPSGIHEIIWKSMSDVEVKRFHSVKKMPNPQSLEKKVDSKEFTLKDWDIVVRSIDAGYKNDKRTQFDRNGTKDAWIKKSEAEKLEYVKKRDYPTGIHEDVWNSAPDVDHHRFNFMKNIPNPLSEENKIKSSNPYEYSAEDWLAAKKNVDELIKANDQEKLPRYISVPDWNAQTVEEQLALLQRHPYPVSFHNDFFNDELTPKQRGRIIFLQKAKGKMKAITKAAASEPLRALLENKEAEKSLVKITPIVQLKKTREKAVRQPIKSALQSIKAVAQKESPSLLPLKRALNDFVYEAKLRYFNKNFRQAVRIFACNEKARNISGVDAKAESRFYWKPNVAGNKNIRTLDLITFYIESASSKHKKPKPRFSALFNVLFKRRKRASILKIDRKEWLQRYKDGEKIVFIKALKKQFVDRYRWHKNDNFLRYKMFRKFFKRQFSRFRHISKNRLFIELFRGHFRELTGFSEKNMMHLWFQFRRGTNKYWGHTNLVQKFSQSILLMPHNLVLFFNLAPSLSAARALVQSGALVINGLTSVDLKYFVKPGDTVQITPRVWNAIKRLYNYQKWTYLQHKMSYISFFQIDWSMLLFTMVSWPRSFELIAPSFLSERWIRYYIRQFPVRTRKYQKVKTVWKEYPRIKSNKK